MKLELFYYDQCPFCQKVLQKIDALGLKDKIDFKNTLENPENKSKLVTKTGRSTVPCLYIDGEPLFESADINQWLEENKKNI